MIIGIVQMDIKWEAIYSNMNKIESFIEEAHEKNVETVFFPEMSLTGFTMDIDAHTLSEEEILKWLSKIAIKYNMNIGLGFGISLGEGGANEYVIVTNEGEVAGSYRKIHPFSYGGEDKKYCKGNEIINCVVGDLKVTPFICYDLRFPEIFQIASKKSDLIIVAANWPRERENHWITLLTARAIENQCYIAGINRVGNGDGLYYNGASLIIDPEGNILNDISNYEELIIQEISTDKIRSTRKRFNLKKDRRENLYRIY